MIPAQTKITYLVIFHAVATALFAGLSIVGMVLLAYNFLPLLREFPIIRFIALGGLVFAHSQSTLAILWAIFGSQKIWLRLVIVMLAMFYDMVLTIFYVCAAIAAELTKNSMFDMATLQDIMVGIATQVVIYNLGTFVPLIIALCVIRFCGFRVGSVHSNATDGNPTDSQFSIRQLMIATIVVAVLITIGKIIFGYFSATSSSIMSAGSTLEFVGWVAVNAIKKIAITCVVLWGTLSQRLVPLLFGIGLVLAMLFGLASPIAATGDVSQIAVEIVHSTCRFLAIGISLFVIRSAGYRMIRDGDSGQPISDEFSGKISP